MTSSSTLVERDNGLVVVTFNRPHRKNALDQSNWIDLVEILDEVENNPEDRALLLTGADGNFSSGADLSGDKASEGGLTGHGPQPIIHEMRTVGRTIRRLQDLPKPTIAVVDGVAVGVALGIAMACDLVVASDRARFISVFVKRGLGLDGGLSHTLPRLVGLRRAKQMAYFGDTIDAATALDWGLVNEVVPPEELDALGRSWGNRLATGPTTAISMIKRQLDASDSTTFAEAIESEARVQHIAYTTKDMGEGIAAFIERRDPKFTGR